MGHYTVDVKNPHRKAGDVPEHDWIHISDDDLEYLSLEAVLAKFSPVASTSATAYMLFYNRVSRQP